MKLIFRLLIFTHIRSLIAEFIKLFNKLVKERLLIIISIQKLQIFQLNILERLNRYFASPSYCSKAPEHVILICMNNRMPELHENWLEVIINVIVEKRLLYLFLLLLLFFIFILLWSWWRRYLLYFFLSRWLLLFTLLSIFRSRSCGWSLFCRFLFLFLEPSLLLLLS